MFMYRERFCEEIGNVGFTSDPGDLDLLLAYAITNPMETEVDGFGSFDLECFVGEAHCASIVAEDERWGLRVSKGDKNGAKPGSILSAEEERSVFGFCDATTDDVKDGTEGEECAVKACGAVSVTAVENTGANRTTEGTRME